MTYVEAYHTLAAFSLLGAQNRGEVCIDAAIGKNGGIHLGITPPLPLKGQQEHGSQRPGIYN